jgi:hypothetical protein
MWVADVPLQIEDNLAKVEIRINDVAVKVHLDSGAYDSGVALTPADAERAKVVFKDKRRWQDAMGNQLEARTFVIPELKLGNLVIRDVPGSEIVYAPGFAPPGKSGHLGFAFLRDYTVVVDYGRKVMKLHGLEEKKLPPECGEERVPLVVGEYGLQSVAQTDRGEIRFGWDTGSQTNAFTPATFSIPRERYVPGQAYEFRDFSLGEVQLGPLKVRTVDLQMPGLSGLMGYDFFASHVVCFDVARKRVGLSRN